MADFGGLSDTDSSGVEELISQAMDLSVLEQIAAINCSGFSDSVLSSELESRFRKLKSFPATNQNNKAINPVGKSLSYSKSDSATRGGFSSFSSSLSEEKDEILSENNQKTQMFSDSKQSTDEKSSKSGVDYDEGTIDDEHEIFPKSEHKNQIFSGSKQNPDEKSSPKGKSGRFHSSENSKKEKSWIDRSDCEEDERSNTFSDSKQQSGKSKTPVGKKSLKEKSKHLMVSSPSSTSSSWMDSPSPEQKMGCLWCSPKIGSKKKKTPKKSKAVDTDFNWEETTDELLKDLNTFSVKEQRKILKQAMKEQQKISQEAKNIIKMAKQASARMNFDSFSDDENTTKL